MLNLLNLRRGGVWVKVFVAFVALAVIAFIGYGIYSLTEKQYQEEQARINNTKYREFVEDIPIVALSNVSSIEGSSSGLLFVQSGKIDDVMYYRLMLKNEKDGKMMYYQLKAEGTYIYEYENGSGELPHIGVGWSVKEVNGEQVWDSVLASSSDDFKGFSDVLGHVDSVSIHVPKGTVDKSFSVNLKQ